MKAKEVLWNRPYILLSIANFFAWLSYNMVTPVMTGYMETLGATVTVCGIVGGLFAFTSLLSRPVSGMLSDTFNRKWLMGIFTVIMSVSLLVYSLVPSIPVILIFRGIHGVAFGISSTASLVLVSESVSEYRMGEAISYYGVMSVASMAIGPGLGIMISEQLGFRACMLIGTSILFVASAAALMFPYHRPKAVKAVKQRFSMGRLVEVKLLDLSGINAAFTMMNGVVSTFLVVFAAQQMIEGVSWHFTINAVVLIASRIFLAKKMNTWSLKQNLYPAFVCGIICLMMIGKAQALWVLLAAAVFKAVAQGMSQPALQTKAFQSVPYEKRGIASSTMYIGGDLGQAIGPMLGGAIAADVGYGNMYILFAFPLAAAFVFFIMSKRNRDYARVEKV